MGAMPIYECILMIRIRYGFVCYWYYSHELVYWYRMLQPPHNPPARFVVGAEFHYHTITRQHLNIVQTQLPREMREYLFAGIEIHAEKRCRQGFLHYPLDASRGFICHAPERKITFPDNAYRTL